MFSEFLCQSVAKPDPATAGEENFKKTKVFGLPESYQNDSRNPN